MTKTERTLEAKQSKGIVTSYIKLKKLFGRTSNRSCTIINLPTIRSLTLNGSDRTISSPYEADTYSAR